MKTLLPMGDWVVNQGLVGYVRILKEAGKEVELAHDGVVLDSDHLLTFAQDFFRYYIKQYSVANREKRRLEGLLKRIKANQDQQKSKNNKELWKDFRAAIKKTTDNVTKYFSDHEQGQALVHLSGQIRDEKEYSEQLEQWISEYIELLRTPEIHNKLTANSFKGSVLSTYHGQVSFLNVLNNALTVTEQEAVFHKDFVIPAIEEQQFLQLLDRDVHVDELLSWLSQTSHSGLSKLVKEYKKSNLEDFREFLECTVNRCNIFDQYYAFETFDEATFSPLAISSGNKNFTWGAMRNSSIPISATAKLILFCASAGATITAGTSFFVHFEGNFNRLLSVNDHYMQQKSKNKAFDEIIFDLIRESETKARYTTKNYLLIEFTSDYKSKKTILDYMMLTPALCRLFMNHNKAFTYLNFALRDKLTYELLNYRDPKPLIIEQLREKNKNSYSTLDIVHASAIRHFYQMYKKGEDKVDKKKESSKIWSLYRSGFEMQKVLGETKARSIAYRLLNAVRAGNKNMFMDTVMRLHISVQKPLPKLFLGIMHEETMDFPTIANSWISGLIARENEGTKKGEDENEEASINNDRNL